MADAGCSPYDRKQRKGIQEGAILEVNIFFMPSCLIPSVLFEDLAFPLFLKDGSNDILVFNNASG